MLTQEEVQQWRQDGFITVRGFFGQEKTNAISHCVNEISQWNISDDQWMLWFEKNSEGNLILSKAENFLDYHTGLLDILFSDKRIEQCIFQLLDEKVRRFKELLIFKYPDSGGYRPHQDVYSVPYKQAHRQVHAVVMIAVDEATPDNGGLFVSKGQHLNGLLPMDDKFVILPNEARKLQWESVTCKPGDIFIFDNYVPHYSRPNKSKVSRRAIYLVFQRESTIGLSREEYNAKKRALAPPEVKNFDTNNLKKPNEIIYRDDEK